MFRGPLRLGQVLLIVALVATLVRLVYVLEVKDHLYWLTPLVDAADFHNRAMQVAQGEGLGQRIFYKAPAYPYLVGQVYRILGPSLVALYFLQMLGGILMTVLLAALGVRWCGPRVGLLAGVMLGAHTSLAYFENQLLIETPALVISVFGIAVLAWGARWFAARNRTGWPLWCLLLAGALFGLALQLRPINAFLILGVLLWMILQPHRWTLRLRHAALLIAPVLLLLIPTLRHNRLGSGEIVPVSVNGGINFYIGNNPDYDSTVGIRPGMQWEALTARFGSQQEPVQWQRNFYRESSQWMRSHPADYAALLWKKCVLFWNVRTIDRNQDSSVLRDQSWMLRLGVPWGLLSWLGLIGLVVGWRLARRLPIHLLVVSQVLAVVAFFVTTRYRLSVVPWLALASAIALQELWRIGRQRDRRAAWRWGMAALLVGLFVLPDHYGIADAAFARPDFDLAQAQRRNGLRQEALASYARAAQHRPNDPDVLLMYAEQLDRLGRSEDARAAYLRASELAPHSYKPPLSLGASYIEHDSLDAAWRWLSESERRGDESGRSLYNMALIRERQRRYAEAMSLHQSSLQRRDVAVDRARARLGIARCLVRLDRASVASVELRAAAAMTDDEALQLDVAALWLEAKRPVEALEIVESVLELRTSARGFALQAQGLAMTGQLAAAVRAAAAALQHEPGNDQYRELLERLQSMHPDESNR